MKGFIEDGRRLIRCNKKDEETELKVPTIGKMIRNIFLD
jgi:hypothetical protein